MIDFSLQSRAPGHQGLRMGLSPGPYTKGTRSWANMIFLDEAAFGALEPAITAECPRYSGYAHWGLTTIRRDEWIAILKSWKHLQQSLRNGEALSQAALKWVENWERSEDASLPEGVYKQGLIELIELLTDWLQRTLVEYDVITIHGI